MSVCIAADFTIAQIVEAMLPIGSSLLGDAKWAGDGDQTKALYIRVHFQVNIYYGDEDEDLESRYVHLIFVRPTNYTKVWCLVNNKYSFDEKDPWQFTLCSDHDSCWRTDGFRDMQQAYFDMRKRLGERNPDIKHDQFHEFNRVDGIEWRLVRWKMDPEDKYHHKKQLVSIERMLTADNH